MASIKETAQAYELPQVKNIADLEFVPTNIEVKEMSKVNKEGEEYSQYEITVEGQQYRVPASVLEGLKAHLKKDPQLEYFYVDKTGSGMATRYTVIPLRAPPETSTAKSVSK